MGAKMLKLFSEYDFVRTPVIQANRFAASGNLYVKLESENLNNNIKSRTAYFMINDFCLKENTANIVESSSGNLGLSLGYFASMIDVNFLCLVDPTVPEYKIKKLIKNNIRYKVISKGNYPDYRMARISYAEELNQMKDWYWINQYNNTANEFAHYTTTGPELYEQMHEDIDIFVCSVGSGGTISGIGKFLKEQHKNIKIVAVEPEGSTIFGGCSNEYLTAGAGLKEPSGILKRNWGLFDYFAQVNDIDAINTCLEFSKKEGILPGITTGSVLFVAQYLAQKHLDKHIVCISPDGGEQYIDIFEKYEYKQSNKIPSIHEVKQLIYIT
jgi:cysteine synthase